MEIIIGIIILILAVLLVIYVILPLSGLAILLALIGSAIFAFFVATKCFLSSLIENKNPYDSYIDKHANRVPGVRRNYFFGPGFHHVHIVVRGACSKQVEQLNSLEKWKYEKIKYAGKFVTFCVMFVYIASTVCIVIFGFVWVAFFSALLTAVLLSGMVAFFTLFSLLWIADRTTLLLKSIQNRCPNCKRKFLIPNFMCPDCGALHQNLTPGPYGILHRKCSCQKRLATTFFTGRNKLDAHCPYCDNELFSSLSRQYGIQILGDKTTGKTTFVAAFWHEYISWLEKNKMCTYEKKPEEDFNQLEEWFESGIADATSDCNAKMYSVIHSFSKKTPIQMTLYDIAGEAMQSIGDSERQQQQFRYCEGFVIIFDPSGDITNSLNMVAGFIHYHDVLRGNKASRMASTPIAIVITKADLHKKQIGKNHIKSVWKGREGELLDTVRNQECRSFLVGQGLEGAINLLESKFADISYFPVSAMGHEYDGTAYDPWGVLDPIFWLMKKDNCPMKTFVEQNDI